MSGSSRDLSYIRDSPKYDSLIWIGYAGQSGGLAMATIIFGQCNPGGRLPITFYPDSYVDAVSMFDMQMRPSPTNRGRTYKFYTGQPVYQFGDGLSYTTFNYSWNDNTSISSHSIQTLIKDNYDKQRVLVHLIRINDTNTGSMDGDDVVLAFVYPPKPSNNGQTPPIKQLFGFERVHLNVNESTQVFFPFNTDALITVERDGSKWLHPGHYRIIIRQQLVHKIQLTGKSDCWSKSITQTQQKDNR